LYTRGCRKRVSCDSYNERQLLIGALLIHVLLCSPLDIKGTFLCNMSWYRRG